MNFKLIYHSFTTITRTYRQALSKTSRQCLCIPQCQFTFRRWLPLWFGCRSRHLNSPHSCTWSRWCRRSTHNEMDTQWQRSCGCGFFRSRRPSMAAPKCTFRSKLSIFIRYFMSYLVAQRNESQK